MSLTQVLRKHGFRDDTAMRDGLTQFATDLDLSGSGPYRQNLVMTRGAYTVVVEQNVARERLGDLDAQVTYPEVAILDGPTGRVAFNPNDLELARQLLADLRE